MTVNFHPYRTQMFEHHSHDSGLRDDFEVCPPTKGSQVGCGRTASLSVVLRDLESSRSELARAVEVIVTRVAGLNERFDDVIDQWMLGPSLLNEQRPIGAVEAAGTPLIGFGLDEIG